MVTGAWDWRPTAISPGQMIDGTGANVTIREVHMKALEECGRIAKTLMDATGHAHLIMRDADFRTRSLGAGVGWEEDDDNIPHTFLMRSESPDLESSPNSPRGDERESDCPSECSMSLTLEMAAITNSPPPTPMNNRNKRRSIQGVKFRRAVHQEAEDHLRQVTYYCRAFLQPCTSTYQCSVLHFIELCCTKLLYTLLISLDLMESKNVACTLLLQHAISHIMMSQNITHQLT